MGLFDWFKSAPPLDADIEAGIERAVATVDPFLRQVPAYQDKLAPAVRHALDYCAAIAADIPGSYEISRPAFAADPLVHALIGSADDIEMMLARSQCVREELMTLTLETGACCALLGMRHREKAGFGVAMEGEIVRHDAPQKTLYFTDHTLAEPTPDPAAARDRLRIVLFDGLVKGFAAHVADVRAEQIELNREQAIEQAVARSRGATGESADHTRRLEQLHDRLAISQNALQPNSLLATLIETLSAPEPYLQLNPVAVCVDRNGIISTNGTACDLLRFSELIGRDKRRWVVILARIRREETLRALERIEAARRHIVL